MLPVRGVSELVLLCKLEADCAVQVRGGDTAPRHAGVDGIPFCRRGRGHCPPPVPLRVRGRGGGARSGGRLAPDALILPSWVEELPGSSRLWAAGPDFSPVQASPGWVAVCKKVPRGVTVGNFDWHELLTRRRVGCGRCVAVGHTNLNVMKPFHRAEHPSTHDAVPAMEILKIK